MIKLLTILTTLLLPFIASAQNYETLVQLPGLETGSGDFENFINSLYILSITIAALLAVIKIIIGGVKYMMTDIVTTKGEAKKDIQGALIGLLIVLSAVLILTIINPQLVNVNFDPDPITAPDFEPGVKSSSLVDSATPQDLTFLISGDMLQHAPDGLGDDEKKQLICETKRDDLCTKKAGSQQSGDTPAGAGEVFCYQGEWDGQKNVCIVRAENATIPDAETKLGGISNMSTEINNDSTTETSSNPSASTDTQIECPEGQKPTDGLTTGGAPGCEPIQ
tara:strand:+ start:42 stop:878 length:837 start_codon:yes stop_codon:yes gene_type:complete